MTGMSGWEDIEDPHSPFGGGYDDDVDGIVFTSDQASPELKELPPSALPPAPVIRPAPQRPQRRSLPQWKPGGDIVAEPEQKRLKRTAPIKGIIIGLIPLVLLVFVILGVMDLYGLR